MNNTVDAGDSVDAYAYLNTPIVQAFGLYFQSAFTPLAPVPASHPAIDSLCTGKFGTDTKVRRGWRIRVCIVLPNLSNLTDTDCVIRLDWADCPVCYRLCAGLQALQFQTAGQELPVLLRQVCFCTML